MKKSVVYTMLMVMLLSSLTACGNKKEAAEQGSTAPIATETAIENTTAPIISTAPAIETATPVIESIMPEETQSSQSENKEKEAILCIGMEGTIKEYKYTVSGKITAEKLIAGIADMTGWNLELADEVTSKKGKMTVCFANTSALFVGPPEKQKKEFMVYDKEELVMTILESVKQTLQYHFADEKLEDSSLDIYFCGEGNTELEFSDINKCVPMDKPYTELQSRENVPSGKIKGKFIGFADPTTIEVEVGGKSIAYQVLDEKVIDALNELEEGTTFRFQTSEEDGLSVITKVFGK